MQKTPRSPPGCGRSQRRSFRRSKDGASARRGANCVLNSLCLNCAYRGASSTKGSYLMMTEKQVVIIGGSEGIGLAVAKAARTLGARVLAVSRTREKLEAARDAVSGLEIRVADINNTASSHASRWFIYLYWRPFFRPPRQRSLGVWHCDDGD